MLDPTCDWPLGIGVTKNSDWDLDLTELIGLNEFSQFSGTFQGLKFLVVFVSSGPWSDDGYIMFKNLKAYLRCSKWVTPIDHLNPLLLKSWCSSSLIPLISILHRFQIDTTEVFELFRVTFDLNIKLRLPITHIFPCKQAWPSCSNLTDCFVKVCLDLRVIWCVYICN